MCPYALKTPACYVRIYAGKWQLADQLAENIFQIAEKGSAKPQTIYILQIHTHAESNCVLISRFSSPRVSPSL